MQGGVFALASKSSGDDLVFLFVWSIINLSNVL